MIPLLSVVAFAALTLAQATLWATRITNLPGAMRWWIWPFALALVAAAASGIVDARGLLCLLILAGACHLARAVRAGALRLCSIAVMLVISAALLLHIAPGFANPLVLNGVVLAPDSARYTKYLSFDKGVVGLFLLGLYAPDLPAGDCGIEHWRGFVWRFALIALVAMTLTWAFGYVRWDPKLPSWWALWLWSMVSLTALPEEAIFRGVAQSWIAWRLGSHAHARAGLVAAVIAGTLFGLAHAAGGLTYVVLATSSGIGYGWIFASTRSIGAAIAAHTTLNAIHFALFSYPALAR